MWEHDLKKATKDWNGSYFFKSHLFLYLSLFERQKIEMLSFKKFEENKKEGFASTRYFWIEVGDHRPSFLFQGKVGSLYYFLQF